MQNKFKRHQKVKIILPPDRDSIEYHNLDDEEKAIEENHPEIKKGMYGKINLVLPNGKYHVEIQDSKGKTLAYAPFDEDALADAD